MSANPDLPYEDYIKTWWTEGYNPDLNKRNRNASLVAKIKSLGLENGYTEDQVGKALKIFMPRPSKENIEMLAIFPNSMKYDADIPTYGKPGRIIKRLFPLLPETACEKFSSWYKDVFVAEKRKMILRVGETRSDFKHAFRNIIRGSGYMPSYTPKLSLRIKSASESCMRYPFYELGAHPAEAYASGDFEVVMVEIEGKVAARCVVFKGQEKYSPGPIYCSNALAANMIDTYIADIPGVIVDCDWRGAKMLAIEASFSRNHYVLPYVDYNRYYKWQGGVITIVGDSDWYGNTGGYCHMPKPTDNSRKRQMVRTLDVPYPTPDPLLTREFLEDNPNVRQIDGVWYYEYEPNPLHRN